MTTPPDAADAVLLAAADCADAVDPTPPEVLDAARAAHAAAAAVQRAAPLADWRVLTVRNEPDPWAGLITARIKPFENRTWETGHEGPVLIHSSAYRAPKNAVRRIPEDAFDLPDRLRLRGHVLAVAVIADCHRAAGCCAPWGEQGEGVWHWQISGVRALPEPIPAKGRLGLWKPDADLVAQALRQLAVSDA